MASPINLNKARKAKARATKTALSDQNRAKFGRTKAEKQVEAAKIAKAQKALDGKKQDR